MGKSLRLQSLGLPLWEEGCAVKALVAADVQVARAIDWLDLLVNPKRLRATLKF